MFGAIKQYAKTADTSNKIDDDGKKKEKKVTSDFLYYDRSVDLTMLVSFSAVSSSQAAPTEETMDKAK